MTYKLRAFLRHINLTLLKDYFIFRSIPFSPDLPDQNYLEKLDTYISSLENKHQKQLNIDFEQVTLLANESGVLTLIDLSDKLDNLQDKFDDLNSDFDRSLYTLINLQAVFEKASILHYIEDLRSKVERVGLKRVDVSNVIEKTDELENEISEYLQVTDGRGKNCHIDCYPYEDRVCFIAYPEDYARTNFQYVNGNLKRVSVKPAFEIIFVYYPHDTKLELNSNFRGKREADLLNIFNRIVLNDETKIGKLQKTYDFNKIIGKDFRMVADLEDDLEYFFLSQLRLSNRYKHKERITLEVAPENERGMETMNNLIHKYNMNLDIMQVTQATFKLKFPGKGNKGSVTMRISYPDKCNLSDSPIHLKARKYLKLWGLENGLEY